MKTIRLIPFIAIATLVSCGGEQKPEKPIEPENPLAELTEIFEDLNEELSEIDGIQEIYTITSESAGDFTLGGAIPVSTDEYTVKEENITTDTEEGPFTETVYNVSDENENLLQIMLEYDYETGEYKDAIGEMNIYSDRFQTVEGIGMGSTIIEFMDAYPDYKIWYTYVSDMYVIETESLGVQFLLDGSGFEGEISGSSDMEILSAEDFSADTKIVTVRMFKI
ncbi:MAG: hypothetical protein GQ574_09675 [Crocinitomix sp.]|nr:hypothetical protein [Crocinitomix sp.]